MTVTHNLDQVFLSGYEPPGRTVTVEVVRNGVVIGSATGPTVDTPDGVGLEINHGPEGEPRPGDCWDRFTPDIRPGDRVLVHDLLATDEVTVDDITFTGPARRDLTQDVIVDGVARLTNGTPIALALLAGEFRDQNDTKVRATPTVEAVADVPGGFRLRYSAPGYGYFSGDPGNPVDRQQVLLGDGHSITSGTATDVQMVDGIMDASGPGPGCEDVAPAASDAVTSATPAVLNIEAFAGGGSLHLAGVAFDNASGTVTIDDRDATTTAHVRPITLNPSAGSQTWTADFLLADLAGLRDGTLDITLRVTRNGTTTPINGAPFTLVKDTDAPAIPAASPGAGSYPTAQQVTVTPGAGTDVLRYTLGGADVPDPTATSTRVTGQIAVTASQTLKVRGFDAAGNAGPVLAQAYTIGPVVVPPLTSVPASPASLLTVARTAERPGARTAERPDPPKLREARSGKPGGKSTARARWRAPGEDGGSDITGYRVVAKKLDGRSVVAKKRTAWLPEQRLAKTMRLSRGTWVFQVRARNDAGKSDLTVRSNRVRAR